MLARFPMRRLSQLLETVTVPSPLSFIPTNQLYKVSKCNSWIWAPKNSRRSRERKRTCWSKIRTSVVLQMDHRSVLWTQASSSARTWMSIAGILILRGTEQNCASSHFKIFPYLKPTNTGHSSCQAPTLIP